MERSFNLIDEAWISVITNDCKIQDISLREALLNAHNYAGLSGETKTQDFAILRLLLALMFTIFYRYDLDGEKFDPAYNKNTVMNNWKSMWKNGYISPAPVEKYFSEWHDRFWLFDDEQPFYQSKAVNGKSKEKIDNAKMIGTLFESANKQRLFSERKKQGRALSYSEAARWLLHLICFDDIAAKQPTPKRSWVGRLGLIALKGKNLFETIMLNFCAKYDINEEIFEEQPSWEQDNNEIEFNRKIDVPDNQAALLSLMSRRVWLCREDEGVNGYYLAGGDYFEDDEVFQEQMTLWRGYREKKNSPPKMKPRLYDPAKKIWREFENIACMESTNDTESGLRAPGVINWLDELSNKIKILPDNYMAQIVTAAVIYDYKQVMALPVIDVISDSLTFHAKLLEDVGEIWRKRIILEIKKCDDAAKQISKLYRELQFVNGRRDKDSNITQSGETEAKMQFYSNIDRPFRLWLEGLKVEQDIDSYTTPLERELKKIALNLGRSFVDQVGSQTIFRRIKKADKNDKTTEIKSSAEVYSFFVYNINKIFDKAGEQNENSKQS